MSEERKALERLVCRCAVAVAAVAAVALLAPPVWNALSPFIIAVPLAALLQPVIDFLQRRLKMKRGLAVIVPVVLTCAVAAALLVWFVSFGVTQLIAALNNAPSLIAGAVDALRAAFERIIGAAEHLPADIVTWLRDALNQGLTWLYERATGFVGHLVSATVNMATGIPYALIYANFLILGLYFIAIDYPNIRSHLPGGKMRDPNSSATRLTNSAMAGLLGYLRVQTTFALLSLLVSWIYLQCLGFPYAALIAMLAATLEFLPLFGNGTLYVPWALVAFILGHTAMGTELMILDLTLLLIRRMTEPKLLSNNIGISPLLSLIGMFVGMKMGGILGLVGGPVVMVVLVGALRGKYFDSIVKDAKILIAYLKHRWASE